jgi:hypothetical protein
MKRKRFRCLNVWKENREEVLHCVAEDAGSAPAAHNTNDLFEFYLCFFTIRYLPLETLLNRKMIKS